MPLLRIDLQLVEDRGTRQYSPCQDVNIVEPSTEPGPTPEDQLTKTSHIRTAALHSLVLWECF
jgi:hypothetical protein